MGKILNNEEIDNYNKNGFFFPLRVMSEEEASYYRDKLEEYEENLGKPISGNERHKAHLLFTWIDTLVRHPLILDAIETIENRVGVLTRKLWAREKIFPN